MVNLIGSQIVNGLLSNIRGLIDNERLHKVSAGDRVIATTGDNSYEVVPPFRIGKIWGDVESTDNLDKGCLDIFLV